MGEENAVPQYQGPIQNHRTKLESQNIKGN